MYPVLEPGQGREFKAVMQGWIRELGEAGLVLPDTVKYFVTAYQGSNSHRTVLMLLDLRCATVVPAAAETAFCWLVAGNVCMHASWKRLQPRLVLIVTPLLLLRPPPPAALWRWAESWARGRRQGCPVWSWCSRTLRQWWAACRAAHGRRRPLHSGSCRREWTRWLPPCSA